MSPKASARHSSVTIVIRVLLPLGLDGSETDSAVLRPGIHGLQTLLSAIDRLTGRVLLAMFDHRSGSSSPIQQKPALSEVFRQFHNPFGALCPHVTQRRENQPIKGQQRHALIATIVSTFWRFSIFMGGSLRPMKVERELQGDCLGLTGLFTFSMWFSARAGPSRSAGKVLCCIIRQLALS